MAGLKCEVDGGRMVVGRVDAFEGDANGTFDGEAGRGVVRPNANGTGLVSCL